MCLIEKVQNEIQELLIKKSSVNKIIRIVAYILRFVKNCKTSKSKRNRSSQIPIVDVEEREVAFLKIVQILQAEEFADQITVSEKEKSLKNNRIQKLNPFLQKYDVGFLHLKLLRVGGGLSKSSLPYEAMYPLLLTKSSHFVRIYFRDLSQCHVGPKALIAISRLGCERSESSLKSSP